MSEQIILKLPKNSKVTGLQRNKSYIASITGILTAITYLGTRRVLKLLPLVTLTTPLTGATVYVNTTKDDETDILTPAGTITTLAFVLPAVGNSQLGQLVRLQSSQIITALTVSVAGSGTLGGAALTAAAVNTTYVWQCTSIAGLGTWTRIQ